MLTTIENFIIQEMNEEISDDYFKGQNRNWFRQEHFIQFYYFLSYFITKPIPHAFFLYILSLIYLLYVLLVPIPYMYICKIWINLFYLIFIIVMYSELHSL